ncbi:hypothetical protein F0562_031941 [Nyssa sinensis]|uniref:tyrosine--tRNA ligase n=1 Tax=Nyssa sinensis TaxID=561372 RepID=A0A5J5AVQ7_9ASTE|nr:hypothetical protein F0562_031941 [Nyssa sinensis]
MDQRKVNTCFLVCCKGKRRCQKVIHHLPSLWTDDEAEVERNAANGGEKTFSSFEELVADYQNGNLHLGDLKPALSKALNKILQVMLLCMSYQNYAFSPYPVLCSGSAHLCSREITLGIDILLEYLVRCSQLTIFVLRNVLFLFIDVAKALNFLGPVRDHFNNDANAKELLKRVKSYKVTK